jgi:Na+/H+-dicarboxylate symporter
MARRFGSSYSVRMLLAAVAGTAAGAVLASAEQNPGVALVRDTLSALADMALSVGQVLAFPLLLGAIIAGSDGLEPMRGAGRLAGKAALWIAGASAAAASVGVLIGLFYPVGSAIHAPEAPVPILPRLLGNPRTTSLSLAVVAVGIGLGIYRNQIEESRSRLLVRFATALRETCELAFAAARPWLPAGVFLVAATQAPVQAELWTHARTLLLALGAGWAVYGLAVVPFALWVGARISPARYAAAVSPAICAAFAGGSSHAIFPVTFDAVCRSGGVSRRVAGTVLSLCAALQRDGQALGLALTPLLVYRLAGAHPGIGFIAVAALHGWLAGCGIRPAWLLTLTAVNGELDGRISLPILAVNALILSLGNSVTLFSQACAAAVIARSEGEKAFLPALPDDNALILDDPLP